MINKKQKIKKIVIKSIITISILYFFIAITYIVLQHFNLTNISKDQIQEVIKKTGPWGPLVFCLIVFLQVTFIPIPGVAIILAGNVCFGPILTAIYCFVFMMLGALFAFKLGRVFGRPFVNWVIGNKETVNKYLTKVHGKEFVVFFFMFLIPIFPEDALCTLAGITPLKYKEFIFMQLISRPTSIISTLIFLTGDIIPFNAFTITMTIILSFLLIIIFIK